jgi:hypothetical protein
MERAVRESDFVLIVCTPRYKIRSDGRTGGVGYEGDIMTGEVLTTRNHRKFIPILRQGEWLLSAPSWLAGKYYVDFRGEPYSDDQYNDLLTTILGTRPQAPVVREPSPPPTGPSLHVAATSNQVILRNPVLSALEPIQITGIVVDEIGTPKGDGSRGSALYTVPFRLSRRPPSEWVQLFLHAWDHPSSYTLSHRPGIASVQGDRVILDGTTVDEIERSHRDTLILATQEANRKFQELESHRQMQVQRERERIEAHKKDVIDAANRIKFS